MEADELFHPGENFRGYIIERLLGKGGMGAVYLARHELLDTLYAIKVLYPSVVSTNPFYIKRFLREAKIATRVHHPNMVAVHDCGHDSDKNLYYLVMDYVVCGDLRQPLGLSGSFKVEKALDIIRQAASALNAMQRFGVVHRDIKPENILLQSDGLVKLVDLGIAKATNLGETTMTTTHSVYGTPTYVSPEQAKNAALVDTRADVYSLGMVLFELLAGKTPYDGLPSMKIIMQVLDSKPMPSIDEYVPNLPKGVVELVKNMTHKNPDKRLASPAAVIEAIDKLGYKTTVVTKVEYTPVSGSEGDSDSISYNRPEGEANLPRLDTMAFSGGDPEIEEFLRKRKRIALLKKLISVLAVILVVGLIISLKICL